MPRQTVLSQGVRGLIHGNTGRKPPNALGEDVKKIIIDYSRTKYACLNDVCLTRKINSEEGVAVSRETVRKIRRAVGIKPQQQKRPPAHQCCSRIREGQSLLWRGIIHQWFPASPFACCLIAVIDDNTGRCLSARFFPYEESAAYLWVLQDVARNYGVPRSLILDCKSLFKRNDNDWSIQEQLQGKQSPTQVGLALANLGVETVFARTKRQKRYLERVFEIFTVCLVEDIIRENIADIRQGNEFLASGFIRSFNDTYALQTGAVESAWRAAPGDMEIERICSFRYDTSVRPDNTIVLGDLVIRIPPGWERILYRTSKVEVRQLLDGSWQVYLQNRRIAEHPPTPLREPVLARDVSGRPPSQTQPCLWTYQPARKKKSLTELVT